MRTDCEIDGRMVICPNASMIGYSSVKLRVGMVFVFNDGNGDRGTARMLGRVHYAPAICDDKHPVRNYILAMVLSKCGSYAYERWINPLDVIETHPVPTKMAAFFFQPKLPYDAQTMRKLMDYGTMQDQFIDKAEHHVQAWKSNKFVPTY